jgi:hypothetical protein
VLYLLDGEKSLLEVVGITRALRAGLNPAIPPSSSSRSTTPTGCGITPSSHTMTLPNGALAGPGYAVTGAGTGSCAI